MKEFFKLLLKIISYSAGFAVFGGIFLIADSIKNKPLEKDEVKQITREVVREEMNPMMMTLREHLTNTATQGNSIKALEDSYTRTLEKRLKDKDEIIRYQKELNEALKKNAIMIPLGSNMSQE